MFVKVVFLVENNKTQAELYREERKARLAKAAAKKAKTTPKKVKTQRIIKKAIAITLAVVLGFFAVFGVLNFFDVPQKAIKVTFESADGQTTYKISAGEFNYYYFTTWLSFYQNALQYEQYMGQGAGLAYTGFDYSKAPSDQAFTAEMATTFGLTLEDIGNPENPTWADAITYSAINTYISSRYGAEMAKKNNITLTDEEKATIESSVNELKTTANQNDFSLNRWLRTQYGQGVTEKVVRAAMEDNYLSTAYYKFLNDNVVAGVTEDEILKEYEANKDNYDLVDVRMYTFKTTFEESEHADLSEEEHDAAHEEAFAKTKEKADKFLEKATDEEAFINAAKGEILAEDNKSTTDPDETTLFEEQSYATFTSYTEELAKWVYDDARQVGDKTVIDNGSGTYYVVMMKALPYQDNNYASVDVRHLLVQFPEGEEGADGSTLPVTDKQKAETKAEAQKILDEFLANEPTEEKFAALATEKTDDPGSKETGGLYEDITAETSFVEPFKKWSMDGSRKPGDVDIVETTHGYHIMYFVESNEGAQWHATVKSKIVDERYNIQVEEIMETQTSAIEYDKLLVKWMKKNADKAIKNILVSNR